MGNTTAKNVKKKNPKELTQEELDYLLNNSHFNKAELIEWHTGFIVFKIIGLLFSFLNFNIYFSLKERMS